MKVSSGFKSIIIEAVCLLFVLLFVYAAVSKLLDFENFQIQLGQSPLLSAFASWISWMVPFVELLISSLLIFRSTRIWGLVLAFNLMTMFTVYIFIILHYSSFIPCSCGGILEKMSWNSHMLFNLLFVVLAFIAFLLQYQLNNQRSILKPQISIPISLISSISFVVILFLFSENIMHYKNPFVRRYHRRAIKFVHSKELKFNSYYFSGYDAGKLYLGNYTTPLHILSIDSSFKFEKIDKVNINYLNIPFQTIRIFIRNKYFYLIDGKVPGLYYGNTKNWKVIGNLKDVPRFTIAQPIDTTAFFFRNNNAEKFANILGVYSTKSISRIHYAPILLEKQVDGIFDTDGMLHYDEQTGKMVFVYFYRNEFFTANKNADLLMRGHTIDTITKAKIKVALLREGTRRKMASPPLVVNAKSAVKNNLLFIESKIQGQYENEEMWKYASIIDVYNLEKNSYILSFPIYGNDKDKLQSFFVTDENIYAIVGTKLIVYRFTQILEKEMK